MRPTTAFNSSAYSYTPDWTSAYRFEESCRRVARAGWDNLEIAAVRPHAHPEDNSPEQFSRLRAALDENDLAPVHVCTHQVFLGLNPASPDPAERAAVIDHLQGVGELCDALEVPSFHYLAGWTVGTQSRDAAWERAVETLDEAFATLPDGVRPLIEPLALQNCDLVHTPEQAMVLVDTLEANTGVLLDILNMHLDDIDPWDAVHVTAEELDAVHLADTDRRSPGEGAIPFDRWFDALEDVGFDGIASVEIWGDNPDDLAHRSHDAIDAWV